MSTSILICGIGGQGTVLAAKLLCQAALDKGMQVKSAETIGMAQRGGSVVSHVRIGDGVYSPLISLGQADVLIAFEPCEAVRNIPHLKKGGFVVTSGKAVQPVTASISGENFEACRMTEYLKKRTEHVVVLDTDELCGSLGSAKAVNTLLLGAAAASGKLGLTLSDLKQALSGLVKTEFLELNVNALELGSKQLV